MEKKENDVGQIQNLFDMSTVLSKNNLNPHWETVRDYFFAVMLATAVYMAFSEQSGTHFYCRPPSPLKNNLTSDDSNYAAAVCSGQYAKLEPIDAFAGPLALAFSLLVYVCTMLWLVSPSVVDLFSVVRKMDKKASASGIEIDAIDKLIQEAMLKDPSKHEQDPESVLLVKKICHDLWCLKNKTVALTLYALRNIVSLLLLGISALIPLHVLLHQDSLFECKIEINNYDKLICAHMIADKVAPSLTVFAVSVGIQMLILLFGLVNLLIPSLVKNDGSLVVHFSTYSRRLSSITSHIISKSLSDIQVEIEAEERGGESYIASRTLYRRTTGKIFFSHSRSEYGLEVLQEDLDPKMEERLHVLKKKVLNAIGSNDFTTYIVAHKKFLNSGEMDGIVNGCGCECVNFNLHDVDIQGKSLVYHALKKRWLSEPDFKVFYHVLYMTTENHALSKDSIVDDGRVWTTAAQFLECEYGKNNASINSLIDVLKKCENKGDFAKYVKMTAEREFIFEVSPRQVEPDESS